MWQVRLSVQHLRAATAGESHELTLDLLRTARVFRCLWEVLVTQGGGMRRCRLWFSRFWRTLRRVECSKDPCPFPCTFELFSCTPETNEVCEVYVHDVLVFMKISIACGQTLLVLLISCLVWMCSRLGRKITGENWKWTLFISLSVSTMSFQISRRCPLSRSRTPLYYSG